MMPMIMMNTEDEFEKIADGEETREPKDVALKVKKQEATVDVPTEGDNTAPADIEDFNDATAPTGGDSTGIEGADDATAPTGGDSTGIEDANDATAPTGGDSTGSEDANEATAPTGGDSVVKMLTMQQPQQAATRLVVKMLVAHLG